MNDSMHSPTTDRVRPDPERLIWGRHLRYLLTQLVTERGPFTVAQMVDATERAGFVLNGRASKTISDALRWEVARGRLVRVGRGTYRLGTVPRTTASRIATRTAAARQRVARLA